MGISVWQLLIILAIVLVLFGAKRLRTLGTDLGGAVKGFKSAVREGEEEPRDDSEKESSGTAGQLEGESDSEDHKFQEERSESEKEKDRH